jgi:hypothetical protein
MKIVAGQYSILYNLAHRNRLSNRIIIIADDSYYKVTLDKIHLLSIIKSFPRDCFYRDKEYPLSPSMVLALKKAWHKQKRRQPFGPKDFKRALYPLIERGLIGLSYHRLPGKTHPTWCLTKKGLYMLDSIQRLKTPDSG